jgi:hypothetical protein
MTDAPRFRGKSHTWTHARVLQLCAFRSTATRVPGRRNAMNFSNMPCKKFHGATITFHTAEKDDR